MNRIPIVWGLDRKYILPAFVVMHSILKNTKSSLEFILLSSDDISDEIKLYEINLSNIYKNFSLRFVKIENKVFKTINIYSEQLSVAAFNRLLIAEYVRDYEKCIYLDCDVLVNGDIKELYDYDVSDFYISGVKDCHIIEDSGIQRKHQEEIGLKDRDTYVNSGVLIMNLKKIREDKLTVNFIEKSRKSYRFEDQDVLNVCCYGKIGILPLKYNLFHFYKGENIKFLFKSPYSIEDFDFDWDKPFILHFGSKYKPWYNYKIRGNEEWWKLAELFRNCDSFEYYGKICLEGNDGGISTLVNKCRKYNHVILWGYTQNGKDLFEILKGRGVSNVLAFADNNKEYWGQEYKGISVIGYETNQRKLRNTLWIVSCQKAYQEVINQLLECGEDTENVIRYLYNTKDSLYYLALWEKYYEEELNDIVECEFFRRIGNSSERKAYILDLLHKPNICHRDYIYLYKKYHLERWLLK